MPTTVLKMASTDREYKIQVKSLVKEVGYHDEQSDGVKRNQTRKIALLIPEVTGETMAFLSAWMPAPGAVSEVVLEVRHPLNQFVRCALKRPDEWYKHGPYLFVMSYGVEQLITTMKQLQNRKYEARACAEHEDGPDYSPADSAISGELTFDTKNYDDSAASSSEAGAD